MHPRTSELLEYLDLQRSVLWAAVAAVDPPARECAPAAGRWSAANVVEHVAIVERRVAALLAREIAAARAAGAPTETSSSPIIPTLALDLVLSRRRTFSAPGSAQPHGLDATAAWVALETAGAAVREALRAGDGLALATLTAPHPIFGPLNFYHWFGFLGAHEARHAAQIREDYACEWPEPV